MNEMTGKMDVMSANARVGGGDDEFCERRCDECV